MSSLLLLLRLVTIRSHRPVIRTFTSSSTRNAPHATNPNPFTYSIRPASPDDIYKINQCNLDNLKENYSHQFYTNHLQRFPDLSFIAETDRFEMVGYALGRMEVLPYALEDSSMYCGHLVSVAVNSKFRGHGVAKHILEMLHENMVSKYYVNSASLFCRVSNTAACHLYQTSFGYQIEKTIPEYYSDREDAYLMTAKGLKVRFGKTISEQPSSVASQSPATSNRLKALEIK
eukprot:gene3952-4228_t